MQQLQTSRLLNMAKGERERRRANRFLVTWVDPRRENCPSSFVRSLRGRQKTFIRLRADGRGRRDGALTRRCLPPPSLPPSGSVAYSGHVSPAFVAARAARRSPAPVGPLARSLPLALAIPYLGTNSREKKERAVFDKNFFTASHKNQY